ncbi:hypothetical protein A2U01_0109914, partial [Trifolium medium]|nr:hypothetical protein [Trifolium medium]
MVTRVRGLVRVAEEDIMVNATSVEQGITFLMIARLRMTSALTVG